jgi:hypothetical protein
MSATVGCGNGSVGFSSKRNRVDQDGGLEMVRVFFLFFTGELSGQHAIAKAAQRHREAVPSPRNRRRLVAPKS